MEKLENEELLKKAAEEITKDKKTAIAFLKAAGIIGDDGELTEPYRPEL